MKTLKNATRKMTTIILLFAATIAGAPVFAHCDSYDGPVITDAKKALETNNVKLVLKWISEKQEPEITTLFKKTYQLKNGDRQVYEIVEKHFFETLVRLHRETEGEPYTGLKPAGSTKQIIQMSDKALAENKPDDMITKLGGHINNIIHEKYEKAAALDKIKDTSPEKGREFVAAYIDYTHTLEALHDIIDHSAGHSGTAAVKHGH